MTMELGKIAQQQKATNTPGTNAVFFLDHHAIKNISVDGKIIYVHIVMDYRWHEPVLNRVKITVEGNLSEIPHGVTTKTADLVTTKILVYRNTKHHAQSTNSQWLLMTSSSTMSTKWLQNIFLCWSLCTRIHQETTTKIWTCSKRTTSR